MSSRTFFLMFLVEDGGISNPVQWSTDSLKSENIVMVLDEENMAVWLWYGSKRGLVSKRTALRQAQSLKGHGYTIGKSIVGRGLEVIYEIDERKIGRVPETDELNKKFMDLVSRTMHDAGGYVVTSSAGAEAKFEGAKPIEMEIVQPKAPAAMDPQPSPAPVAINPVPSPGPVAINPVPSPGPASINPVPSPGPASINPVPSPGPASINPVPSPGPASINPVPSPAPAVEGPPAVASEYADDTSVPEPTPLPVAASSGSMESVQKGCVITAILSQFKDIWVSRLDDGTVSVEYMDGPIAKFHIEQGKVKFHEGSFSEIEPATKSAIKAAFDELIRAIK